MLDKINPKIIIKYLDMRFINHREAPIITIFECEKQKLSDRVVEYIHINRIKILFVVLVAGGAVLLQKVLPISGFKFVMIIGIGAIVFGFIYEAV